jgi:phosphoglucosamine mutase
MGKYFGTDGFRGEANIDLTADHAMRIGRFLGHHFSKEKKGRIVIGKDTRLSSYMLEDALSAGVTSTGTDAYLMHVTTTPSVSFIARSEHFDCGVMISASHNAFYDNGIKLINGQGEKMDEVLINQLEYYLDGGLLRRAQPVHRLPDFPGAQLLQGLQGGPGLRQRQHLDDCQVRV